MVLAILSSLVLHHRVFLAIGSAGTVMFLLNIKDVLLSDMLSKNASLFMTIVITILIAIVSEYLVNTNITATNIFFDTFIAVITSLLIERFSSNSWVLPSGLLIFFILVICFNFDANLRRSRISTESNLFEDDSEDSED